MNWDAIGAVGELASAVAVLITLIYLARQVAQSARQQNVESSRATSEEFNRLNSIFFDTEKSGMISRAFADWEQATVEEQTVAQAFLMRYAQHMQLLFEMRNAKVIEESVYLAERRALLATLATPGGSVWWGLAQSMYSEPFVDSVSEGLKAGEHPVFLEIMPWFDGARWPRESITD